jgi:hypothetical protein
MGTTAVSGVRTPAVQQGVQRLREILAEQLREFALLLDQLAEERGYIRARQIEAMTELTASIMQRLDRIRRIDRRRQELTVTLTRQLGLSPEHVTLELLDQALGGQSGLAEDRQQMLAVIDQADRANRENRAITKGMLIATDVVIRAVSQGAQQGKEAIAYDRLGGRKAVGNLQGRYSRQL